MKTLDSPYSEEKIRTLEAGEHLLLSGIVYTARDQAHKRIVELIKNGEEPPFEIKDCAIYYVGPTPARPGGIIGSAGPTTSYRMDPYAPLLIENGQRIMIGKGSRSENVIDAMKRNGAVYLAAVGGAGALLSKSIKSSELIAFEDLGTEAVRKLEVIDMPLIVAIDSMGNDLYSR